MSTPSSCCVPCCPDTELIQTPGLEGDAGAAGAAGTDGVSSFTTTTANFVVPAAAGNVTVSVANSSWMVVGQNVVVAGPANFRVSSKPNAASAILTFLDYPGDVAVGATITSGAQVGPSGYEPVLSGITSLTDNTTGVASNTLAAPAGVYTLSFFIDAAVIANGDLLTNYVPGHKFKILKFDARCAAPVTTAAKASNLNLEINTTNLTGGVIALAGLYALGAAQAGTAISGANTGNATDSFSIEAAATTAFVEGSFWLLVSIQNMDSADALASLAAKVNAILAI